MVDGVVLHFRRAAEEEIPRQPIGDLVGAVRAGHRGAEPLHDGAVVPRQLRGIGLERRRPRDPLRPESQRAVRPHVHFAHVAERAARHVLDAAARDVERVTLVAHLRHDLALARLLGEVPCLVHRPAHRLLHVDVLADAHRRGRNRRVHVIGRRDDHRVDVLLLGEHLAVILILGQPRDLLLDEAAERPLGIVRRPAGVRGLLRLRPPEVLPGLWRGRGRRRPRRGRRARLAPVGQRAIQQFEIDVADRDDVLAHDGAGIGSAHPRDAHRRDVHQVAGRLIAAAEHVPRHDHQRRASGRGRLDECPPGYRRILLVHASPGHRSADVPSNRASEQPSNRATEQPSLRATENRATEQPSLRYPKLVRIPLPVNGRHPGAVLLPVDA